MTQPLTFVTMCPDADAAEELRRALTSGGRVRLLSNCETAPQLYLDATRTKPDAAIMMLGAGDKLDAELIRQLTDSCPEVALVTTARDASPAQVMSSLRAGAREFLQLPVNPEELEAVLNNVAEFCATERAELRRKGRVVAVFSNKGGSGCTFIAANVAASIGLPTILVDLNLQAGDADSFLNLEPQFSVADAAKNLTRLDHSLLGSYVLHYSPQLSLLAAPAEPHEGEDIQPEDLFPLMRVLREEYRCVVLDLQHTFDPVTVAALDQADDILLVLTLDIPGIRNAKRALKVFDRVGYPREKVNFVLNRWTKNADVELKKVEGHLGERIVGFIPNDYKRVIDSINLGQPLVQTDPSSRVSVEITRIASMLAGGHTTAPEHPRKGLFGTLFSRRARAATSLELRASLDKA